MIEIFGQLEIFERKKWDNFSDPDGIYSISETMSTADYIVTKGTNGSLLNGTTFIPFGKHGFYYPISESRGVKVFYNLEDKQIGRIGFAWEKGQKLFAKRLSPKPLKKTEVQLKLKVGNDLINVVAPAILNQRIHFPLEAMKQMSKGLLYDFNCLSKEEHPLHCMEAFKAFRGRLPKILKRLGITPQKAGMKLGDIIYCVVNKRWYLADYGS